MLLPANPYYPSPKKRLADDFAFGHTKPIRRRFAATGETDSRPSLVWPLAPYPGPMTKVIGTIDLREHCPSALSSSYAPGTTRKRTNESSLPCKEHRWPSVITSAMTSGHFYLGHTPRLERLKYSADQAERRATKRGCSSPSCVSHRLCMADHVAIPFVMGGTAAGSTSLPAQGPFAAI